jgi:large subunit ribosomal protein L17
MRHKRAGLHLSRTAAHRKALFSNMVAAVLTYERIRTTEVKAKEIRRLAERTITWARRLGAILTKKPEKRTADEKARVVHAMRMALRVVRDRDAVLKLFDEIGPRFLARHGGYTRLIKVGQRPGDAAPMALLELIPAESQPETKPTSQGKGGKGGKEPKEAKVAKDAKDAKEGAGPKKGKTAGTAASKTKAKSKPDGAAKAKKDTGARTPAKSAATMKRSGRSRGGE